MRPRISIRGCVHPSVGRSVRRSVGRSVRRSVRDAFVKIAENGVLQDGDASYVVYTTLLESNMDPQKKTSLETTFIYVKKHGEFNGATPRALRGCIL